MLYARLRCLVRIRGGVSWASSWPTLVLGGCFSGMIGTGIDEPREAREEPAGDGWGPSDGGFATSQRQWSLVTIAAGRQMKRERELERARAREGGCASRDDLVSVHRSQCMVCVCLWAYGGAMVHGAW